MTGTFTCRLMPATIAAAAFGSRRGGAPSRRSDPRSCARGSPCSRRSRRRPGPRGSPRPRPMTSGSEPAIWTIPGRSSGDSAAISSVRAWPRTIPSAITISVAERPHPSRRAIRRNAMFVKPAMGARTSGGSMTRSPRRIGPGILVEARHLRGGGVAAGGGRTRRDPGPRMSHGRTVPLGWRARENVARRCRGSPRPGRLPGGWDLSVTPSKLCMPAALPENQASGLHASGIQASGIPASGVRRPTRRTSPGRESSPQRRSAPRPPGPRRPVPSFPDLRALGHRLRASPPRSGVRGRAGAGRRPTGGRTAAPRRPDRRGPRRVLARPTRARPRTRASSRIPNYHQDLLSDAQQGLEDDARPRRSTVSPTPPSASASRPSAT